MAIPRKKVWRTLRIIVFFYVLGGALFYVFQDRILFHPVSLKRDHQYDFKLPHRDVSIPLSGKSSMNVVQFQSTDTLTRGVVLYFHGNKKNISWYEKYAPYFTREGYELWMIDYPGYGKSTGELSEATLYQWAEVLYRFARSRFPAQQLIIYGKSMGTGIAAYLASRDSCQQLILETPYYDFPSVVRQYLPIYPVGTLLHYQFPTHQYLTRTRVPVTILHGDRDGVVWYKNAKKLQKEFKAGDTLVTIQGGSHNNLFDYPETVQALKNKLRN